MSRAFDDALAAHGCSHPVWLILVALQGRRHRAQRDLAEAVGIEGPTLTHHLNRLELAGLVVRMRDPDNRRVHRVDLTPAGQASGDAKGRALLGQRLDGVQSCRSTAGRDPPDLDYTV